MIPTSYFTYDTIITFPDAGPDLRLSRKGVLQLLQEAATIASDRCGFGLEVARSKGVSWVLAGWRLELLDRPRWNQPISVRTWPRTMEGFLSERDFLVYSGEKLVARATSSWLLVSTETGRIARITDEVRSYYQLCPDAVFDAPLPKNGVPTEDARETFSLTVGRRDIDTNGHVNNINYLDYALEALPQALYEALPSTVEIVFRRQILLGTPIRCLYAQLPDGRHQVEIQSGSEEKPVHHAFVWFY